MKYLSVRSFDNTRSETIQFYAPLTLIVGYNGSGKTTIIECLKYATTGDLPPNSKTGGAFIHDPKLCGEKEVLAQVKLSFKSTSGAKMVATRSLQLSVMKAVRKQKTLDCQLLMIKDGERTAISSRVAELDQIMPQYLGVSKAILDSVIFCHQDESLWPLSEPSVLKKKFDEIFEALKYTKAVENIKVLRKNQNIELGKYKIIEQHSKEDKDKADRAEKKSKDLQDDIESLRSETMNLNEKMTYATKEVDKYINHGAKYEGIIGTLKGKQIEARTKEESISDLQQNITEMEESDEWLTSTMDQYEERMSLHREQMLNQTQHYKQLESDIEGVRQRLGSKQKEAGKYEAEKAHHEQQLLRREAMIKESARRHNVRGYDSDLDETRIRDFMEKIGKMAREQDSNLQRIRREIQEELHNAQNVLNQFGEQRSAFNRNKDFAKGQIESNDSKIVELQKELDRIEMDEGAKAALESTIQDIDSRLKKEKKDFDSAAWDNKIQDANARLRFNEDNGEKLNTELIESTRQANELASLNHLKKELKDRQFSLETMTSAHGDKISEIIGRHWEPSSVEREFYAAVEQKKEELTDAERQRDGVSRELEQVEFKFNTNRGDAKKKQQEMQDCEQQVRDAIDDEPSEYPDIVSQLETSRDITKHDVDGFTNMRDYFSDCLKTVRENEVCRLCRRSFRGEKERAQFIATLDRLMSTAAQQVLAEELQVYETDLKKAREANSSYDIWQRLKNKELPALEVEGKKLDARRDVLLAQLEEKDKLVRERREARREVEAMTKTTNNITRYLNDIVNLETSIKDLSATQEDAGLSRTLDDIQEQLHTINEEARSIKATVSRLNAERERARGHINTLELELRDVQGRLNSAVYQLEKKNAHITRVDEIRQQNQQQRAAMKKADKDIQSLAPQVSKAQTKYDDIKQRGTEKETELQQEASKLSDSVHHIKLADEDINSYIDRGGPGQIARSHREVDTIHEELGQLEREQRRITQEVNRIKGQLDKQEMTKRSIQDNLRYRRDVRALETINAEIAELEAHNAEVDRDRFAREVDRWTREHNKLSGLLAGKMGEMKTKDDQLMQLLADWETDYKDAKLKFKEAHIKVETTKAAVEDLGRYGGALDKAIMKYHSIKMEEINRIVEELWKRTYQGTDVDTIIIRSDVDGAKGKSSYNYRVCMVKQDAEMDMRGRCSAGQKVLASIIIRLALAECFGVNCGLIALDEPTTNLDRDNIRSLAESLHDIIQARQQQTNFQLIVITHDEEFLRYMKCADFCDNYYRVSRNERQKSIIERQSIAEVV
ncbi:MAG: DNA repair protein rad50 [Pycnora praestabilis]|nr:MAG: DNA repair protein rad50 [Pycnora praestabilis]